MPVKIIDNNWKSEDFRQIMVDKIENVIQDSATPVARTSTELENHVFMKAKCHDEYVALICKIIFHIREFDGQ